jgi:pimeloyl-ACP methyl ester carboxylesterase
MQTTALLNAVPHSPARRFVWKGIRRILKTALLVLLVLIAMGLSFEQVMQAGDATRYPALGQVYLVDGYEMHLRCMGEGSPTVVFIGGAAALSYQDAPMQGRVSTSTRACIYDRAGYLWSEARPEPRTAWQLMVELHCLLETAGIEPPYVLVGSSNGGIYARAYAYQYPDEVVGMVLVDARLETELGKGGSLPTWIMQAMGQIGLFRLFPSMICPPNACDPAYAEQIATFRGYASTLTTYEREVAEGLDGAPEQIALLNEHLGRSGALGNMMLVILQANQYGVSVEQLESRLREYVQRYRAHYTSLSSNAAYQLIDSGHGIAVERPEVVQRAIEEVLAALP